MTHVDVFCVTCVFSTTVHIYLVMSVCSLETVSDHILRLFPGVSYLLCAPWSFSSRRHSALPTTVMLRDVAITNNMIMQQR